MYVRSYRGKKGSWYKHVQQNNKGRVSVGEFTKDVDFLSQNLNDKVLNDKIDTEYRSKYQKYSKIYVDPMISSQTKATTIRLDPI